MANKPGHPLKPDNRLAEVESELRIMITTIAEYRDAQTRIRAALDDEQKLHAELREASIRCGELSPEYENYARHNGKVRKYEEQLADLDAQITLDSARRDGLEAERDRLKEELQQLRIDEQTRQRDQYFNAAIDALKAMSSALNVAWNFEHSRAELCRQIGQGGQTREFQLRCVSAFSYFVMRTQGRLEVDRMRGANYHPNGKHAEVEAIAEETENVVS